MTAPHGRWAGGMQIVIQPTGLNAATGRASGRPAGATPRDGSRHDAPATAGPGRDALSETLRRAAAGDEGAWLEIVGAYARRVFALARSRRLDEHQAEDVTQSVFVTVAKQIGSGDYTEQGRFEAWLFRVAMNRVRDQIRKQRRRAGEMGSPGLEERADPRPQPPLSSDAELNGLRAAMERLGEADREVVELRHHAGMGFKEIAALLGQPLGTVLARHHRALGKLREWMSSGESEKERAS